MTERDDGSEARKPYILDFISLQDSEYLIFEKLEIKKGSKSESGLNIIKMRPDSGNAISILIDETLLETTREWLLSQPIPSNSDKEGLKQAYELNRAFLRVDMAFPKSSGE